MAKPCPFCGESKSEPIGLIHEARGVLPKSGKAYLMLGFALGEAEPRRTRLCPVCHALTADWDSRPIEDELRARIAEMEEELSLYAPDRAMEVLGLEACMRIAIRSTIGSAAGMRRLAITGDAKP